MQPGACTQWQKVIQAPEPVPKDEQKSGRDCANPELRYGNDFCRVIEPKWCPYPPTRAERAEGTVGTHPKSHAVKCVYDACQIADGSQADINLWVEKFGKNEFWAKEIIYYKSLKTWDQPAYTHERAASQTTIERTNYGNK